MLHTSSIVEDGWLRNYRRRTVVKANARICSRVNAPGEMESNSLMGEEEQ